mmetsp:Transcript_30386/g.76143  ORF Transcript_30386/g.76143 Transcript_30386/m.76143 type:complete len:232 (+) Transcript_30386:483-1178(+)
MLDAGRIMGMARVVRIRENQPGQWPHHYCFERVYRLHAPAKYTTLHVKVSLADARKLLNARMEPYDAKQAAFDLARPSVTSALKAKCEISIGDASKEGMRAAAHDKRTGEWKVCATVGRKTKFDGCQVALFDHHIDKEGKQMGRRKQESNYFLTVNTNKRKFDEVQEIAAMQFAINECFNWRAYDIMRFGPAHPKVYGGDAQWPRRSSTRSSSRRASSAALRRAPCTRTST